ncbi:Fe-S cluster assembly protein SufB [Pyrodictium occultum]|uniref:Fe-S cluster assembly protein SufB n=1 Tax=Pyrodictium occultum TaxID=2309 RepID=A0A0V8RX41_PYROC|nr:Fe-S cluster assembly protein SufB [Pyrodictium occultum]KSW12595.1 Fe-S cluster assembly protein SufB [Pyrodictium occultum]
MASVRPAPIKEVLEARSIEDLLGIEKPYPKEIEIRGRIERSLVEEISRIKKEPDWMRRLRLRALEMFYKLPMPRWVRGIEEIDLEELAAYVKPKAEKVESWDELPDWIKEYYAKLGLPEAEAKALSGLTAVFDSEAVLNKAKEELRKKGVILLPLEEAVQRYPDLVKQYFGRVFPVADHKFAALHYALWSGGAFVYVPPGVKVRQPIEAFFFVGSDLEGQFEHSLIVADENSYLEFIEGCAAPVLKKFSFHDGMVELYAHRGSRVYFYTVQNWSRNIINFNNKRAIAEEGAYVEWLEGSIGSRMTYTYPSTILRGRGASTRNVSVAIANGPYIKDTGGKAIHAAPETRSVIVSKSISSNGGLAVYRGLVRVNRGAYNSVSHVECDSLVLDEKSKSYTYPRNEIEEPTAEVTHEASVGRLGEDQLFYMTSRGLTEGEVKALIVLGFIQDILKSLPLEYLSVLTKVIELEFSEYGAVG